jgi:DNA-binding NtrC family response regulator
MLLRAKRGFLQPPEEGGVLGALAKGERMNREGVPRITEILRKYYGGLGQTFRADLFYRLNVFPLEMPALRERRTDVPLLVEYFIHRYATRAGKSIRRISKETSNLLQTYDWPGNIRELQNVIERAVIVSGSDTLSIDERWLSGRPLKPPAVASPRTTTLATREKDVIEAALTESKGRVAGPFGAAARLGVPSSTLESKIKALRIDKRRFKST